MSIQDADCFHLQLLRNLVTKHRAGRVKKSYPEAVLDRVDYLWIQQGVKE